MKEMKYSTTGRCWFYDTGYCPEVISEDETLYACLVNNYKSEQPRLRSSWHQTLEKALEHAEHSPGVLAIERIGHGIVWERPKENNDGKR